MIQPEARTRSCSFDSGGVPRIALWFCFFVVLVTPARALANGGIPMLMFFLPPALLLLLPIVVLESYIGVRRFGFRWRRTLMAQACANAASTIVGLPLTWLFLLLMGFLVLDGADRGLSGGWQRIYDVTINAPWISGDASWGVIFACTVSLAVPFYLMSVLVEYKVLRRWYQNLPREEMRAWVVQSNLISYLLLIAVIAAWTLFD